MHFLPAIILLGIVTTYEDIKRGKIRNLWIIIALFYAIVMNTYLLGTAANLNPHYLIELFSNLLFAIAVGFGLWHLCIWTAGDGKLFIAFAALIPLSSYSFGYMEWIPSMVLLINVFVPATLLFVFIMFWKVGAKKIFGMLFPVIKTILVPKSMLISFIQFFSIIWLTKTGLGLLGLGSLAFIGSFAVRMLIGKLLPKKSLYFFIIAGFIRLIFDSALWNLSSLYELLILVLVWRTIRSIYRAGMLQIGHKIFSKEISPKKLRPGMVLSDCILRKKKLSKEEKEAFGPDTEIKKHRGSHYIKTIGGRSFFDDEPEGLTKSQILKIQDVGFEKIKISSTIPFAPFMFSGAILTLLANGNILISIVNLLN